MKFSRFEDIIAWQKAQNFAVDIYAHFENLKDWNFKHQICDAVISISNNIAEGFDRSSDAEFRRFLFYALGSCSEVKSMLYLAPRLKYLKEEISVLLRDQSSEISKIINGLIKSFGNSSDD